VRSWREKEMLSEMKESFINLIDIERILMKRRIRRTLWQP
jgi:hypothetical protein